MLGWKLVVRRMLGSVCLMVLLGGSTATEEMIAIDLCTIQSSTLPWYAHTYLTTTAAGCSSCQPQTGGRTAVWERT